MLINPVREEDPCESERIKTLEYPAVLMLIKVTRASTNYGTEYPPPLPDIMAVINFINPR